MTIGRGLTVFAKSLAAFRQTALQAQTLGAILLGICCGCLTNHAYAQAGGGPAHVDGGAFRVQFWERGDNGGSGANQIFNVIPDANLGLWSADERAAIIRAFEYITDTLNLPVLANVDDRPVVRIIKDESTTFFNANALPVWDGFFQPGFPPGTGNIVDRLINNNDPVRVDDIDARLVFQPGRTNGVLNVFDTSVMQQLTAGDFQLEPVAMHEIGHILGLNSLDLDHLNNVVANTATGPNSVAVFGGAGVPLEPGDPAHVDLEFHNITRGTPFGIDFRNIPFLSPAELAIYADIGYNVNLGDNFGAAFYQPGTGPVVNATGFNSTNDYGVGVFIHADGQQITQVADITASGLAGTGIRITGRDTDINGNSVTIGTGVSVSVDGSLGIGILASSGANHRIIHRGSISATGTDPITTAANGRGILIDFGPNLLTNFGTVDSTTFGVVIVDQLDISGNIMASLNAIEIGDTAAVDTINIMNNPTITGDIRSDALNVGIFTVPTLRFGDTANAVGVASGTADAAFNFTFNDDIGGVAMARGRVDLEFFGGTTTLNGNVQVEDVTVGAGNLMTGAGSNFDGLMTSVGTGTATFGGTTSLTDVNIATGSLIVNPTAATFAANIITIGENGTFASAATTATGNRVDVNGGTFRVNGGTMTVNGVEQRLLGATNGQTVVDGTAATAVLNATSYSATAGGLTVDGANATMTATNVMVSGTGTTVAVTNGATLNTTDLIANQSTTTFDANVNIANNFNATNTNVIVGASGNAGVTNSFTQSNGTTNVIAGGQLTTLNATSNTATNTVNGTWTATNFNQSFTTTNVGGVLNANAVTQTSSNLNVQAGGAWNGATATTSLGTTNVAGNANLTGLFTNQSGTTTVANGGVLGVGDLTVNSGVVDVQTGGTLNVTNAASATNAATLNGGSLLVNGIFNSNQLTIGQNSRVGGAGSIVTTGNATVSGVAAPGNSIGTLNFTNVVFGPTSTLEIELDAAGSTPGVHNDLVNVTNNATIAGGTLELKQLGAGELPIGNQYTFLQAGNALTVTTPFTVQELIANRRFIEVIDLTADSYSVLVAREGSLIGLADTDNARRFADFASSVTAATFLPIRNALDLTPDPAVAAAALNSLHGEIYATVQTSQLQATSMFMDNIASVIHGGGYTCNSFAENPLSHGFWSTSYGWVGEDKTDGNARTADVMAGGTALGYGWFISDSSNFGVFYGGEHLDTDVPEVGSTIDTETHRLGVYHESRFGGYYLRGMAAAAYSRNESQRGFSITSPLGTVAEQSTGSFHSWQAIIDAETGWCMAMPQMKIEPLFGVRYIHTSQEGFSEQGGALTSLIFNSANLDSLRARAGARFSTVLANQSTFLSLDTFWQINLIDAPTGRATAALVVSPTGGYLVEGPQVAEGRFTISPAIRQQLGERTTLFFRYRGDLANNSVRNAGEGGLEIRW